MFSLFGSGHRLPGIRKVDELRERFWDPTQTPFSVQNIRKTLPIKGIPSPEKKKVNWGLKFSFAPFRGAMKISF
jgi:hypothetical protein